MLLAVSTLVLLAAPKLPLVGTYEVAHIAPGRQVIEHQPKTTPQGAVRHFVIDVKGRWAMFDMMVAFAGTAKASGRVVTLTFTHNPSGKMRQSDVVVFDTIDEGRTLISRPRKPKERRIVYIWKSADLLISPVRFLQVSKSPK